VNEQSVNEQSVNEQSVNERWNNGLLMNERLAGEQLSNEELNSGQHGNEKSVSDKSVSDKSVSDKSTIGSQQESSAYDVIDNWFDMLKVSVNPLKTYFVSDVTFRSKFLAENDSFFTEKLESYWAEKLSEVMKEQRNVHALKLTPLIQECGKKAFFSDKLWYMGKIPWSNEGTKLVAGEICRVTSLLERTSKKVLILDLDNTLWGGVLGERGVEGIELSDDHLGAVYKKVQRKILQMKRSGVLLAICSKNNLSDVEEVWERQPHMLLKRSDFVAVRINWADKADNLTDMAKELNLGLDSFVFIDDMPAERENIISRLPDVAVPDFPEKIEGYPSFMDQVYEQYFQALYLTREDQEKTRQYEENAKRQEASAGLSYEEFLCSLHLKAERVQMDETRLDRVAQLFGKTNQFNLTTHRYSRADLEKMLQSHYDIYAYQVSDRFGDYGLVAVAVVDTAVPEIDSFLMSCRIMGKQVEQFVIDEIEGDLLRRGYTHLKARYLRTKRNAPVAELYESLGYQVTAESGNEKTYSIDLTNRPERRNYVNLTETCIVL
ncbi:MAG: HAD-IIIC family phosphatase, partial [Lachnospiraceae bacterium]|nr:HAD-IIIC family phosphatase [Lachnospiraceae bacterium]